MLIWFLLNSSAIKKEQLLADNSNSVKRLFLINWIYIPSDYDWVLKVIEMIKFLISNLFLDFF